MDALERCYKLAKAIAIIGWTNSQNPMVQELVKEADENGIDVCFDDSWIAVEDEVFYIQE